MYKGPLAKAVKKRQAERSAAVLGQLWGVAATAPPPAASWVVTEYNDSAGYRSAKGMETNCGGRHGPEHACYPQLALALGRDSPRSLGDPHQPVTGAGPGPDERGPPGVVVPGVGAATAAKLVILALPKRSLDCTPLDYSIPAEINTCVRTFKVSWASAMLNHRALVR